MINNDQLLVRLKEDIQAAESFHQTYIQPKVIERYQLYNADKDYYAKKFAKLSRRSSITTSDIADTIEWCLPSLMRIFFGGRDVITIQGRTEEDDRQAEVMQKLVNYQIQTQNPGFMIFYRWFKDALITGLGIVKAYWERDWETLDRKQIVGFDELEIAQASPDIEIVSVDDLGNGLFNLHYKQVRVIKNQPIIENIPASEFIYYPDATNVKDSPFVAHRKLVTTDYLLRREKEGIYKNVEQAINAGEQDDLDQLDYYLKPYKQQSSLTQSSDKARRKFLLYECYTKYDINEDGLLEDVIVTVVNNTILRVEENLYGRPPFFVISPILEPYQIWGKSYADILQDLQDLKTALLRQIVVNIALANDPRSFVNEMDVNIDDLVNDKQFVRVRGNPQEAVYPIITKPLAPWTFNFIEYIEGLKENKTGITRYNQGLDARSLNKTATGISMIMQAANQRLELIARIFAETGVKELFSFLVELNNRFIDQETVIRLTNERLIIRPDDLKGVFDLIIEAGIGVGTRETTIANMQMLLNLYPQLLQLGIATPKNIYHVVKKLIETLGYKNVDDFIQDPEEVMHGQGARMEGSESEILQGLAQSGTDGSAAGNVSGVTQDIIQQMAAGGYPGMGDD